MPEYKFVPETAIGTRNHTALASVYYPTRSPLPGCPGCIEGFRSPQVLVVDEEKHLAFLPSSYGVHRIEHRLDALCRCLTVKTRIWSIPNASRAAPLQAMPVRCKLVHVVRRETFLAIDAIELGLVDQLMLARLPDWGMRVPPKLSNRRLTAPRRHL